MPEEARLNARAEALSMRKEQLLPDRVTPEYMLNRIQETSFIISGTMTICVIRLDNGFQVTGESACVDPKNYNKEMGEKIAHDNAFNKLWPLFGFLLTERRYQGVVAG